MIKLKSIIDTDTIDTSRLAVKKTGTAFLIVGCFIGLVLIALNSHVSGWLEWSWQIGFESGAWKWVAGSGLLLFILSRTAYPVMKPFHTGWMTIGLILAWLSSNLILTIYFYLVIMPTGLIMRLVGKDLLDRKINTAADTYWVKREQKPFSRRDFERLF